MKRRNTCNTKVFKLLGPHVIQELDAEGKPTGRYSFGSTRFRAIQSAPWKVVEEEYSVDMAELLVNVPVPAAKE